MPEQSARIEDGSGNIIVQATDSTVSIGAPATLKLYPWHRRPRQAKSDVALLDPFTLSVPFVGRAAELARLEAWLSAPALISARCLTGRAGSGKTRLAIELCARADAIDGGGWDAGFLTHAELQRFFERENISTWGWRRPTLIVLDYAAGAGRALKPWLEELSRNVGDAERRLRLLLLERFADDGAGWWAELMRTGWGDAGIPELFDPPAPEPLDPIAPGDRGALRAAIADVAGDGAPERVFVEGQDLSPEALDLLMAGLTAARSIAPAGARPVGGVEMAQALAGHERRRLDFIARDQKLEAAVLAHAAAMLTLQGGADADAVLEMVVAETAALCSLADPRALCVALRNAYAREDGERLPPILPDLIGEAFVLDAFSPLSANQQAAAITRARVRSEGATIATVMRAAQDFAEAETHPALRWLDALIDGCADAKALTRLMNAFPQQTLMLRERAALVAAAIADHLRDVPSDPSNPAIRAQRASILNNLSSRLFALDRREEALEAIKEAVAIFRDLAAAWPDAFREDLAGSLNNLSNALSAVGRREEALAAIEKAVSVCRDLTAERPSAFQRLLALSLHNRSEALGALGRREEALTAIEKAVEIRGDLAAAWPDVFRTDLASSLNNLSVRLSDLGRREEALTAIKKAVQIRRELASARPDGFRPDLARSLSVQGECLEAVGDLAAAMRRDHEALALLTPYFVRRPLAFVGLIATICQRYLRRCEALGVERDEALLAPVLEAFQRMQGGGGSGAAT